MVWSEKILASKLFEAVQIEEAQGMKAMQV
jgi:hypothetical protein